MLTRYLVLAGSLYLVLAACGPKEKLSVGKTVYGETTRKTEYREISPREFLIGVTRLEGAVLRDAEQRIRDNNIIQQRANFGDYSYIYVEYKTGRKDGYPERFTGEVNDLPTTKKWLVDGFHIQRVADDHPQPVHIYERNVRGGWLIYGSGPDFRTCAYALVGLLSDSGKFDVPDRHYDAHILFRDCDRQRTREEIVSFLEGLRIAS